MQQSMSENIKRFNYLTSEINALYHDAAVKLGLSESAMQILYTVCLTGDGCLLSDICKLSGTSKQTINSSIRKLEREGIVYLASQNGRNKLVLLTNKGKKTAQETAVRLIAAENQIFDSWSKQDQEEYLRLTQKYLDDFKEKLPEL